MTISFTELTELTPEPQTSLRFYRYVSGVELDTNQYRDMSSWHMLPCKHAKKIKSGGGYTVDTPINQLNMWPMAGMETVARCCRDTVRSIMRESVMGG